MVVAADTAADAVEAGARRVTGRVDEGTDEGVDVLLAPLAEGRRVARRPCEVSGRGDVPAVTIIDEAAETRGVERSEPEAGAEREQTAEAAAASWLSAGLHLHSCSTRRMTSRFIKETASCSASCRRTRRVVVMMRSCSFSGHSRMSFLIVYDAITRVCGSSSFVIGDRCDSKKCRSIADRSYVYPSAAVTGSFIGSSVIGQRNSLGISGSSSSAPSALRCALLMFSASSSASAERAVRSAIVKATLLPATWGSAAAAALTASRSLGIS
mmetsp:Transcript_54804/g.108823  ORF Transcript_54804/g.108823 Transcript_54804/m.108823 type:complete len:269 (-) Transcript_54804:488-1294(-)